MHGVMSWCGVRLPPTGRGSTSLPSAAAAQRVLRAEQAKIYKPLLDVRPEYLNSGLQEVRNEFGSFNTSLREGLGMDGRALRARNPRAT
ncbi:tyrosine-protein phosphatase [Streptomyces sp. NPDC055013]